MAERRFASERVAKWCKERVGTVHTFQGKEERSVILVLGADGEHARAVDWASSKPNILNVALTRAQRRFYLVGDRYVWGGKGCFGPSLKHLKSTSPTEFLAQVQNRKARSASAASGNG